MGCTGANQVKEVKRDLTLDDVDRIECKPASTPKTNLSFYNVLWFDPRIWDQDYQKHKDDLKKLFNEAIFVSSFSEVKDQMGKTTKNVVFVSCGEKYDEVKDTVETHRKVIAICIFAQDLEKYKHLKTNQSKVVGVIDNFDNLNVILKDAVANDPRSLRFCDSRKEKTFHTIKDKDTIIKSLTVANESDSFSIFYPLGVRDEEVNKQLTGDVLKKIENTARNDETLKQNMARYGPSYMDVITQVTNYLYKSKRLVDVLKAYTMENLYYMMNLYLRFGTSQCFETFKEYIFCLKASMCIIGTPATNVAAVYRGLGLSPEFLKLYVENKGKFILLNGFTSTTIDKDKAIEFTMRAPQGIKTLYEISLVPFDESFSNFINDFGFPEENGVFFPVDISKVSVYDDEKEVLFPPFYPIKIINVRQEEEYCKIIAQAPSLVSIAGKDFTFYLNKIDKGKISGKHYNEDILDLTSKKIIDKLSLVNSEKLRDNPEFFDKLLKEIKIGDHIQKIILFGQSLEDKDITRLVENNLMKIKSLKSLILSRNYIVDDGAILLAQGLQDHTTLEELDLNENRIRDDGAIEIAIALKKNKSLRVLLMAVNDFKTKGAIEFASTLKTNNTLKVLNLMGLRIKPEGIRAIGSALNVNKGLNSLYLAGHIDDQGAKEIGLSLKENVTLKILYLDGLLDCEEGFKTFTLALKENKVLTELYLGALDGEKIPSPKEIGLALLENKALTELVLTRYEFTVEDSKIFEKALKENTTLKKLTIYESKLSDECAIAIGLALKDNKTLKLLNLMNNKIEDEGAKAIGVGLKENTCLEKLTLSQNEIGEKGAESIALALKVNKTLKELSICKNKIGEEGVISFVTAVQGNNCLTKLKIAKNVKNVKGEKLEAELKAKGIQIPKYFDLVTGVRSDLSEIQNKAKFR